MSNLAAWRALAYLELTTNLMFNDIALPESQIVLDTLRAQPMSFRGLEQNYEDATTVLLSSLEEAFTRLNTDRQYFLEVIEKNADQLNLLLKTPGLVGWFAAKWIRISFILAQIDHFTLNIGRSSSSSRGSNENNDGVVEVLKNINNLYPGSESLFHRDLPENRRLYPGVGVRSRYLVDKNPEYIALDTHTEHKFPLSQAPS